MEENLFNYLRKLGEPIWRRLFRKRAPLRAIFRSLGELEKLIVLRLLNINQAVSERALRLWMNPNSFSDLRKALSLLQSYHIIKVSENRTKEGKPQYELQKDFKNEMLSSIHDVSCDFDSGLELLGNITTDGSHKIKGKPAAATLIKYSRERLDFLVLFLVSQEVRRNTLRAIKITKKIKKLERLKEPGAKSYTLNSRIASLERQLSSLTKYGGTLSTDVLKVLQSYRMVSDQSKKSRQHAADSSITKQALSWLLKGVDKQLVIILVGHLQQIESGYLTGFMDSKVDGNNTMGKEVQEEFRESDDKASMEKVENAEKQITESVELLLSLSQAKFGDVFSARTLTKAQHRLIRLLIELGAVYADSTKDKFYVSDLSFLVGSLISPMGDTPSISMSISGPRESKILVQSNFKVYIYTANALQLSVLSHICELQARTPNLVIGVLTRSSVQAAFKSGITAEQITGFFEAKQRRDDATTIRMMKVPENVRRQLKMWEEERNRLELTNAILFKRWDVEFMPELFKRAVRWAQAKRYELFHTKWPPDIYSEEHQKWLRNEKYLVCTFESKEEVIDKIKQIRMSLADEKNRALPTGTSFC
ncbi:transcription factor TFIIH subunit p52/TFB2 [Babesia gibsoni]|uniref:General transcription factor IIH subunit 4 n=1 Tax=Babesia gibsoni TaxID=33632 RepID=A0AAD8PDY5_BABGI|nr:transcription factor TFIIH subunit p52/TFB2 [Babesia gibsoni]